MSTLRRTPPPDVDQFRIAFESLHARVLDGDRDARDKFCQLAAPILRRQLRRWFQREALDEIESGVNDALLKYLVEPGRYDPGRGGPLPWLLSIGYRAVVDARRRRWRRRSRETCVGVDIARFPLVVAAGIYDEDDWLRRSRDALFRAATTADEREFIQAKLSGQSGRVLAETLRVGHLPECQQAEAVKRRWKTILRRLQRHRRANPAE